MVVFSSLEPNDAFDASIPYFVGKYLPKPIRSPLGYLFHLVPSNKSLTSNTVLSDRPSIAFLASDNVES